MICCRMLGRRSGVLLGMKTKAGFSALVGAPRELR